MSITINSPYDFTILRAGRSYPEVLAQSRGGTELSGFYALRELGLERVGDDRGSYSYLLSSLRPIPDFSAEAWVVDAWTHGDNLSSDERKKNVALIVKGLPDPRRAGPRGRAIFDALQRHLSLLADVIPTADSRAIEYNVGVLSALLGKVDQLRSHLESRQRAIRFAAIVYLSLIAIAGLAALSYQIVELLSSSSR